MSVRVSIRMHFPLSVRLSDVIRDERERERCVVDARPSYLRSHMPHDDDPLQGAATQEPTQDIAG